MINKCKQKDGSAGGPINYILGGKRGKDQIVTVIDYNGFAISHKMLREIESVPNTPEQRRIHKKLIWKYTQEIAKVFDSRADMADYRVKRCNEEYILGFSPEDSDKINGEFLRQIVREFLEGMGVHGEIEVTRHRGGENIKEVLHREALYLACFHGGTNAPHIHLFSSRIASNGMVNDTRDERIRSVGVCRKLSKKYGLALRLNGEEVTEENGYTIAKEDYNPNIEKTNEGYRLKLQMAEEIRTCLKSSSSKEDFAVKLRKSGIEVSWRVHKENGKEYGAVFTAKDSSGRRHTYSGSQLDKNLSYGRIMALINAANKADVIQLQNIWKNLYAPMYSRAVEAASSAYNCHLKYRALLGEVGGELSEQFERMKDLKERSRRLESAICNAPTKEAVLAAICAAVAFINPIVALAAKIIGSSLILAGQRYRMERRREICSDLSSVWQDINSLRAEQASLRKVDRQVLSHYAENRSERNMFKQARTDASNGLGFRIIPQSFPGLGILFPTQDIRITGLEPVGNYEVLVFEADGARNLAVRWGNQILVREALDEKPIDLGTMIWRGADGHRYIFEDEIFQEDKTRFKFLAHSSTSASMYVDGGRIRNDMTYKAAAGQALGKLKAMGYGVKVSDQSQYERDVVADGDCYRMGHLDVTNGFASGRIGNSSVSFDIDAVVGRSEATEPVPELEVCDRGRFFLQYTAPETAADDGAIQSIIADYNIRLDTAKNGAVRMAHEQYDKGLFRKAVIEDVTVDRLGQGSEADVSVTIKESGKSEGERHYYSFPDDGSGRRYHARPYKAPAEWVIPQDLRDEFNISPGDWHILDKDWACLHKDEHKMDIHAYAVATPYGKQYLVRAVYYYGYKYDRQLYLSEPIQEESKISDLTFYSPDRRPYNLSHIIDDTISRREAALAAKVAADEAERQMRARASCRLSKYASNAEGKSIKI